MADKPAPDLGNLKGSVPQGQRGDPMAAGIATAARGDCRTRYADQGILAAASLLADAVTGDGCRW